jgi:apolipoprotein D and lipocalin family protein
MVISKMKTLSIDLIILFFMAVNLTGQSPQTVEQVDLQKYLGLWYDIASYPAWFQKGCRCTTAEYELVPGKKYIRVTNRCIRFKNGRSKINTASGKAFIVEGSNNSKLKVQFFWPFRGDYHILGLAEDYSWSLVGHPKRKYLWILCRESLMPTHTYNEVLLLVRQKGYNVDKLVKTPQHCDIAQ